MTPSPPSYRKRSTKHRCIDRHTWARLPHALQQRAHPSHSGTVFRHLSPHSCGEAARPPLLARRLASAPAPPAPCPPASASACSGLSFPLPASSDTSSRSPACSGSTGCERVRRCCCCWRRRCARPAGSVVGASKSRGAGCKGACQCMCTCA